MFTGIVSGIGRIVSVRALGPGAAHGRQLVIETPAGYLDGVRRGDSIAVNGACMTVTALDANARRFHVDVSAESLDKTAGLAEPGAVNLELAVRAGEPLGGHLVSGHVDGIGRELAAFGPLERLADSVALRFTSVTPIGDDLRLIARPATIS